MGETAHARLRKNAPHAQLAWKCDYSDTLARQKGGEIKAESRKKRRKEERQMKALLQSNQEPSEHQHRLLPVPNPLGWKLGESFIQNTSYLKFFFFFFCDSENIFLPHGQRISTAPSTHTGTGLVTMSFPVNEEVRC